MTNSLAWFCFCFHWGFHRGFHWDSRRTRCTASGVARSPSRGHCPAARIVVGGRTLGFALVSLAGSTAFGQAGVVQQPVVRSFSVGTSVDVPDRGEVLLGGVGRAAEARSFLGPSPGRGASARSVSSSSISVRVFVHDFEALDAAVLNAAQGAAPRPAFTKGRYDDATSQAMSRRWASGGPRPSSPAIRTISSADEAERLFRLGEAAEMRGDVVLARLHYRVAAQRGSAEARQRLLALAEDSASAPQ
jgi:hypothetical protein